MRLKRRQLVDVPVGDVWKSWTTFRHVLRGQGFSIFAALVMALAIAGLELLKPWPIKIVIDRLFTGSDSVGAITSADLWVVGRAAMAALVIPILLGLASMRMTITVAKIGRKATVRLRKEIFAHLHALELAEHQQRYTGDLLVRLMGDVNMVRDLLFSSWVTILARGSVFVGALVAFAFIDWRLELLALLPLPLLWVGVERTSKRIKTAAGKQRRKEGAIAAYAAESLRNVALVKAFAAENRATERFVRDARSAERATLATARYGARMQLLTESLTGMGVALVFFIGAARVMSGLISPGDLLIAISYSRLLYKPLRKLTGEGARLAKATACSLRLMDLLDRPIETPTQGIPVSEMAGAVEFIDVAHAYPDGRPSLRGVDFRVPAGTLVAITGENGSGKSTAIGLVLRLHTPIRGRIEVDGTPIGDLRLDHYRSQIAYVPQELSLFGGTIRDNILFGRPAATDADVWEAARLALFDEVVRGFPEGLDTVLTEDGSSLSGGQARRLMLARAAIRDASLLLLDEPLSGLDPDARLVVSSAIRRIAAGRTTFVVHHGTLDPLAPDVEFNFAGGRVQQVRRWPVAEVATHR